MIQYCLAFGAMAILAALMTVPANAENVQARRIKFGHFMNPGNPIALGAERFATIVSDMSGGKLEVRVFPSGQLGSEAQQQSALVGGTQEMTAQASSHLVGIVKELGLLDFPFVVQTRSQADRLHDGRAGRELADTLSDKGLVALGYWENGFRHVTNSKRPIRNVEDMAGLKIRVQPNPVFIETFKAFGANPVPLSFSELYTALETGALDAQENPLMLITSSRFFEVQSHVSLTGHVYGNLMVLVGKRFWDKLSETEQRILREAFVEAQAFQREESRRQARQAIADLEARGMQINTVLPAELERMRRVTLPIRDRITADYDPALVRLFTEELERISSEPAAEPEPHNSPGKLEIYGQNRRMLLSGTQDTAGSASCSHGYSGLRQCGPEVCF